MAEQSTFDSESFLRSLTRRPGVYRMLDSDSNVLYVGKARNLRSRVTSYFRASGLATKTMALMSKVHDIQVTATASETEALLLEQSLIKADRPTYNVLFRDDKSYPYICLTEHPFPRSHNASWDQAACREVFRAVSECRRRARKYSSPPKVISIAIL